MLTPEQAALLRDLVSGTRVAALGTLHHGAPFVSMVPFAVGRDPAGFVIHVSRLAGHTRDMLEDGRVSLLVMAADAGRAAAQGLARVTVQGLARQVEKQSADEAACRAAYLGRFPDAEPLLAFGDFSFFLIAPTAARFVGGFAQATSVDAAALAEALR